VPATTFPGSAAALVEPDRVVSGTAPAFGSATTELSALAGVADAEGAVTATTFPRSAAVVLGVVGVASVDVSTTGAAIVRSEGVSNTGGVDVLDAGLSVLVDPSSVATDSAEDEVDDATFGTSTAGSVLVAEGVSTVPTVVPDVSAVAAWADVAPAFGMVIGVLGSTTSKSASLAKSTASASKTSPEILDLMRAMFLP
jgi:hypothetical protein